MKKHIKDQLTILKKHANSVKKLGWCDQCQYPWNDGICECGHGIDLRVINADKTANELFKFNWNGKVIQSKFGKKVKV